MSLLKQIYNTALVDEILCKYFHDNKIPTVHQLTNDVSRIKSRYPRLCTEPYSLTIPVSFSRYEAMNAEKYNNFWGRIQKDEENLSHGISTILSQIIATEQNWRLFYNRTTQLLKKLESRVDELLFINQNTLGYFSYVKDDFSNLDYTDLENSTCTVSTDKQCVFLPISPGTGNTIKTRVELNPELVKVNYKVSHPNTVSSTLGTGVSSKDIVKSSNKPWYVVTTTTRTKPSVAADIIIDLGTEHTFNSITANLYSKGISGNNILTAFYSADKIDWIKAGSEPTISTTSNATWVFNTVSARYIRFLYINKSFDSLTRDGKYMWCVGFDQVYLEKNTYITESATRSNKIFRSIKRDIVDFDGNLKPFNKVLLEACEIIPNKTNIKYEISVDEGTSWLPIANTYQKNTAVSPIVDVGNEKTIYSIHNPTRLIDSINAGELSINLVDAGISDRFGNYDAFVNLTIDGSDLTNVIYDSIQLFRNTGKLGNVRNSPAGWRRIGNDQSILETHFVVLRPEGRTVDLGPVGAVLDGSHVRNTVFISKGKHTLQTNINNWAEVNSGAIDDTALKLIDPLFPYNHKLIIEGYEYGDSEFAGIYSGMPIYAELVPQYVPIYSYNVIETPDLDVFTYTIEGGKLVFVVRVDPVYDDFTNETFELIYRTRENSFTSIILRASFSTTDSSLTPILKDYTLKVG